MIQESEVLDILGNKLPALNPELEKLGNKGNVYKTVQCFADFTKALAGAGNMKAVRHCINLAEEMLTKGNSTVQNAIENVFLHTLSPLLDLSDAVGLGLNSMLRGPLRKEYLRRVSGGGI
ncbi:MAG: hypothetical protein ACHQRM_15615 [Bacteroidia bacterium]